MTVRRAALIALSFAVLVVSTGELPAHPGSGIVVEEQGQVFFADLTRGLLRIDAKGNVTTVHKEGGHWLALDRQGSFSRMQFAMSEHWPRWFKRRTPDGVKPGDNKGATVNTGTSSATASGAAKDAGIQADNTEHSTGS